MFDPVCVFHGLRASEHQCLYCCLCFAFDLPIEAYHQNDDGSYVNVCEDCWAVEEAIECVVLS